MPRLRHIALVPAVLVALLALPAAGGARTADDPVLLGSVGTDGAPNAFRISLTDEQGNGVARVLPGTYTLKVHDYADTHNFHFYGPGPVSVATDIEGTGDATFTVTLVNGAYTYQCDAHPSSIRGTLQVGAPPPPPPPPTKLTAAVAGSGAVALRKAGVLAKSLRAGRYLIAVADASKKQNFHLTGPGVNTRTTLVFKGAKTLAVTLKQGTYRYRSDARPKLGRVLKVTAAVPPR